MRYEEALDNCIFRFISGSHAYGFNVDGISDTDFRGVFIAPLSKAFDLFGSSFVGQGTLGQHLKNAHDDLGMGAYPSASERIRQAMMEDQGDLNFSVETVHKPGEDEELHELRKFLKLAADCNPNISEFLWIEKGITHESPVWSEIRENRDKFLSKKARYAFSGYAISQLHRIQTHRGYLLNPPRGKPTREDFGLPTETVYAKEYHGAALALPVEMLAENVRDYMVREKRYEEQLKYWQSYERWSRERNPRRREMEAKYGYDVKHACHLVRLIRMAKEILVEGTMHVHRPDWQDFADIRAGKWPFEKILEVAENADADLEKLYKESKLRDKPDRKGIAQMYVDICEKHYGIKVK